MATTLKFYDNKMRKLYWSIAQPRVGPVRQKRLSYIFSTASQALFYAHEVEARYQRLYALKEEGK